MARPLAAVNEAFARYGQPLYQAPNDQIKDMPLEGWGSPLQPVKPMAPAGSEPYSFQIWPGQNLIFTPRPDANYTAVDLMSVSTFPLARICIENVKDVLTSADREVMLKPRPGESKKDAARRAKGDENLLKLNRFFDRPDREHDWGEWTRQWVNDMLVGDWAALLVRRTRGGEIVEIPRIAGETIQKIIDKNGFTPLAPDPAYAQVWWGLPRVDFTTEQLVYKPRNIVPRGTLSSQLYGYSPTEQLAPEIEIGIQRLMFVLAYYTEGSIPGMLQVVPRGTPTEKIAEAMNWMNSELAGNLAKRRQIRMIQGWADNPKDENIQQTKEALLSDPYDDQLIRRLAFGYGTSAQRLLKQMNRASAEQADDSADTEGTRPYFVWMKSTCDYVIQVIMGMTDYEMKFDPSREPDIKKEMETITGYIKGMVLSPNQGREKLGEDPDPDPLADKLGTITATGWTPIDMLPADATVGTDGKITRTPPQKPDDEIVPAGGKPNGKPAKKPDDEGAKAYGFVGGAVEEEFERGRLEISKTSAHETRRAVIHPARLSPRSIVAKHKLESAVRETFRKGQKKTVRLLRRFVGIASKVRKKKYGNVQFVLSPEDAKKIFKVALHPDDLAPKGRDMQPHVTVLYGLHPEVTEEQINALTKGVGDVKITLGELEAFPAGEDGVPLVIRVESDKLRELRAKLEKLPHTKTFPEYKPHICVAYLKPETDASDYFNEGYPAEGETIVLSDLVFSDASMSQRSLEKAAEDPDVTAAEREILNAIASYWEQLADAAEEPIGEAAAVGADLGAMQLDITNDDMLSRINETAASYARRRAAEMVGMRRTADGELVENPDAKWAITETTREKLREIISDIFSGEAPSLPEIEERIQQAGIFSDTRASMIAKTEIANAQVNSNLNAWRESGLVKTVSWQTSADHDRDDVCDENEAGSPYKINEVPEFPAHPNCECVVVLDALEGE